MNVRRTAQQQMLVGSLQYNIYIAMLLGCISVQEQLQTQQLERGCHGVEIRMFSWNLGELSGTIRRAVRNNCKVSGSSWDN